MSAMIERAAKAVYGVVYGPPADDNCTNIAIAALLAALDAEALRETIMRALQQGAERNGGAPYDAIKDNKHYMEMLKDQADEVIRALAQEARG